MDFLSLQKDQISSIFLLICKYFLEDQKSNISTQCNEINALLYDFFMQSKELCQIEALSFLTEEKKIQRQQILKQLSLQSFEISSKCPFFQEIWEKRGRIFLATWVSFDEWLENVQWFECQDDIKQKIWQENPLFAVKNFLF